MIAVLFIFFASLLDAQPSPVFTDVYIGACGPSRLLVDTGAQTSLIDPQLAAKLQLKAEYRVELMTPQSTELVPGAKLTILRLRDRALPETEVLFHDVAEATQP